MPRSWIERIREKVRLRQYDMTVHAVEELAEDGLDIADMEHAVFAGRVVRIERGDPRGNKFRKGGYVRLSMRILRRNGQATQGGA